jgi:hypothetical protein
MMARDGVEPFLVLIGCDVIDSTRAMLRLGILADGGCSPGRANNPTTHLLNRRKPPLLGTISVALLRCNVGPLRRRNQPFLA